MHTTTKPHQFLLVGAIALAALVMVFSGFLGLQHTRASGQAITCSDLTYRGVANILTNGCIANGSTTPVYLTAAAASTTMTINTGNSLSIALNLLVAASSTATTVTWSIQRSFNGIDWYSDTLASSTVAVHSGLITGFWTPGTTATSTLSTLIPLTPAKFTRVNLQLTGGNGSVYAQTVSQSTITN